MVELQPSKLIASVRFRSLAFNNDGFFVVIFFNRFRFVHAETLSDCVINMIVSGLRWFLSTVSSAIRG